MSKRALIVEDDRDLGGVLLELLEVLGYESELAQNVEESILLLKNTGSFDVLITDHALGEGTGVDLIDWCKARAEFNGLRFVLTSGYGTSHFDPAVLNDSRVAFLHKPFALAQLKDALV